MPAWIHGRAEHILAKNPSMPKSEAFAIATQQSHAAGKSPKGYGTLEGREQARDKYKTPGDDRKTANPGHLESKKMEKKSMDTVTFGAFADEIQQIKAAGLLDRALGALQNINRGGGFVGGGGGGAPSAGFQAFQQRAAGAAPKASLPAATPAVKRTLPPMNQPLNPGGMSVMFSPKAPPVMPAPVGRQ